MSSLCHVASIMQPLRSPARPLSPAGVPCVIKINVVRRCPAIACAASAPGKGPSAKDNKLAEPATPPQPEPQETEAGAAVQGQVGLSTEDIPRKAAELQPAAQQQQSEEGGFFEGLNQEVGLIQWPSLKQAILNTLLVITIVGGTSALLFGVNTVLAELSRTIYG